MANPLLLHEVNLDQVAMLQGNMIKPALCRPSVRLLRWTVMGFCCLARKPIMAKAKFNYIMMFWRGRRDSKPAIYHYR
jgi:hypothetical protein